MRSSSSLGAFCTSGRAEAMAALHERDAAGREIVGSLVAAFGASVVPAFLSLLDDPAVQPKHRPLAALMCAHAALLAPALVHELGEAGHCGVAATRAA